MSKRASLWLLFALTGFVALVVGGYFGHRHFAAGGGAPAAGTSAAQMLAVSLPDLSGTEQSLSQWRGKVLVVNFWATWCVPCREEMPEFVRAQDEYGGKGLQFVGIAVDSKDKVEVFAKEIALNYPALIGGFGAMELSKTFGNRLMALPFTVVIGRDGTVAHTQLGPLKKEQLHGLVTKLL